MKEFSSLIPSINNRIKDLHNSGEFSTCTLAVTENEKHYLQILYSLGSPTFTEFAEEAGITKPAATQVIKKLIEKNYVVKNQCKKDRRVYYLEINTQVKKYFEDSSLYLDKIYEYCLSFLNEDEKNHLKKLLSKINDSLYQIEEEKKA